MFNMWRLLLVSLPFLCVSWAADPSCYAVGNGSKPSTAWPVECVATTSYNTTMCFLMCGVCTTPELRLGLSPASVKAACVAGSRMPASGAAVASVAAEALNGLGALQGHFWNDGGGTEDNATAAVMFLLQHMPRRDMMRLFNAPVPFIDFLFRHVRFSLLTWPWAQARGVTWDTFLNYVVPYTVLDEKLDMVFGWRARFHQVLAPKVVNAATTTAAARAVVNAVPFMAAQGALALMSELVPGAPVTWHSETSPGFLSPQQVVEFGGSCTGTAIVLVAALRAVGVPTRLAGCSQSIPNDDHKWVEFWDASIKSPFGDAWHTKEGVSTGNSGGPWDSPSAPMNTCLKYLSPGSTLNTIWAASWTSPTFLPTLWATNTTLNMDWVFVGGVNRCGAYCTAWGCGQNQTHHYTQEQCAPVVL